MPAADHGESETGESEPPATSAEPPEPSHLPDRSLVVWLPDWPVLAVGADPDTPAAVVEGGRVVACSFAARADGVRRGQKTRDAQRLSPSLALHSRDENAEARAFEPVLAILADVTPSVEVLRPGLAALPLAGPARYFGGEEPVASLIRDRIGEAGIGAGIGVADGVFAATLAARGDVLVPRGQTPAFLAPFPATVLDDEALTDPLANLGVRTLGRLADLPADSVAGRFGAAGVAAHRLARGLDARPPAPRRQGPEFAVETLFDPPADRSERIVFAAKALADELHAVLAQAGLACVRVAVELHGVVSRDSEDEEILRETPVSHRLWRHDGLLSSTAVAERVRWQLSGWQPWTTVSSSADGTESGISLLRFIPDHLVPARGVQPGLWGSDEAPDRIARAAERLQAMLGHAAVTLPAHRGGRTPADQGIRIPYGDLPPDAPETGPGAGAGAGARARVGPRTGGRTEGRTGSRSASPGASGTSAAPGTSTAPGTPGPPDSAAPWPARLPDPAPPGVPPRPHPAVVTDRAGNPVRVSGRVEVSAAPAVLVPGPGTPPLRITSWAGPWPLAERWWDPERARRRARFQAVTADGRAWLLCVEDGRWHVEAVYD